MEQLNPDRAFGVVRLEGQLVTPVRRPATVFVNLGALVILLESELAIGILSKIGLTILFCSMAGSRSILANLGLTISDIPNIITRIHQRYTYNTRYSTRRN